MKSENYLIFRMNLNQLLVNGKDFKRKIERYKGLLVSKDSRSLKLLTILKSFHLFFQRIPMSLVAYFHLELHQLDVKIAIRVLL